MIIWRELLILLGILECSAQPCQAGSGQGRPGQNRAGQGRPCQARSEQGQGRAGPGPGQGRARARAGPGLKRHVEGFKAGFQASWSFRRLPGLIWAARRTKNRSGKHQIGAEWNRAGTIWADTQCALRHRPWMPLEALEAQNPHNKHQK